MSSASWKLRRTTFPPSPWMLEQLSKMGSACAAAAAPAPVASSVVSNPNPNSPSLSQGIDRGYLYSVEEGSLRRSRNQSGCTSLVSVFLSSLALSWHQNSMAVILLKAVISSRIWVWRRGSEN
ncbi:hypothetical protein MLD38_035202 [Melastoma candidum]|uniref:Uncharacterized protein n=1 Tax=Melastoma candidum TaxID=119954 RepID=A0ACB9MFJ2_9MYRT|nr:hypothetical protein MLD38_035202 [Melastoma candidum]